MVAAGLGREEILVTGKGLFRRMETVGPQGQCIYCTELCLHLQMVKVVNFSLRVFYHNFFEKEQKHEVPI